MIGHSMGLDDLLVLGLLQSHLRVDVLVGLVM